MSAAAADIMGQLAERVARSTQLTRDQMLDRLGDLFSGVSHMLDDRGVDTFDAILVSLTPSCSLGCRSRLADAVAADQMAPPRLIRLLAFDDEIEVARPVLTLSPLLLDADMIALATVKSLDHLLAMSRRKAVSPHLTDMLLSRADGRIRVALAGNKGAAFSAKGRTILLEASLDDDELYDAVTSRDDLQENLPPAPAPERTLHPGAMARDTQLEDVLRGKLVADRIDDALSGLAAHLTVRPALVAKAFQIDIHGGFLAYAKAADIGWPITELFIQKRYAAGGIPDRLSRANRDFDALSVADARRVVALLVSHAARDTVH
jgi:hypothetical protein